MAGHEESGRVLRNIDLALESYTEDHPLARAIAEATGIDTVVVASHGEETGQYAGALHAARVALAHFGPMHAAAAAGEVAGTATEVLDENIVRGEE